MARYHLSPITGSPQMCTAQRACRYGLKSHYPNKAEAYHAYELANKDNEELLEGAAKPSASRARKEVLENAVMFGRAHNNHSKFKKSYLNRISTEEQLILFDKNAAFPEEVEEKELPLTSYPIPGDLILKDNIIYEFQDTSKVCPLNEEVNVEPLVATARSKVLSNSDLVILNNYEVKDGKLQHLTSSQIDIKQKARKEDHTTKKEKLKVYNETYKEMIDSIQTSLARNPNTVDFEELQKEISKKYLKSLNESYIPTSDGKAKSVHRAIVNTIQKPEIKSKLTEVGEVAAAAYASKGNLNAKDPISMRHRIKVSRFRDKMYNFQIPEPPTQEKNNGFIRFFGGNEYKPFTPEQEATLREIDDKTRMKEVYRNSLDTSGYIQASSLSSLASIHETLTNPRSNVSLEDKIELNMMVKEYIPETLKTWRTLKGTPEVKRSEKVMRALHEKIVTIKDRSIVTDQSLAKKELDFLEMKLGVN